MNRRELLFAAGSIAPLALLGCKPGREPARRGGDVVAAGPPAALLIYALAPHRLAGWPRRLARPALDLLGPAADLPELGALNAESAPANLEAIAALKPALILDYGDITAGFRTVADRLQSRTRVPYQLIDGALTAIPTAILAAGALLESPAASALAELARKILHLAGADDREAGPSFYYARGADGLETGFAGSLATEVLEHAGWSNVATGGPKRIARVTAEQLAAWDPEVIVTLDRGFARAAAGDPAWRRRRNGARRRLVLYPALPFGWIDRPPSLNRLIGLASLTGDPATVASVSEALYHRPLPSRADLAPQWLD